MPPRPFPGKFTAAGRSAEVESITRARIGLAEDVRGRQRRYVTAMSIRTACVVLMAATWGRWPVLALGALAGALVIPYVAVVVAEAGWGRRRGVRPAVVPTAQAPAVSAPLEPTLILPPLGTDRDERG